MWASIWAHTQPQFQPSTQDFETSILWLIKWYISPPLRNKPKNIVPKSSQHHLHTSIMKILMEIFTITHSYYLFPLTCPMELKQNHSLHPRDIQFGWVDLTLSYKSEGTGYAHPPYHQSKMKAIYWARIATQANHSNLFIIITQHTNWESSTYYSTPSRIHIPS